MTRATPSSVRRIPRSTLALFTVAAATAGCSDAPGGSEGGGAAPEPADAFRAAEERLLEATDSRVDFRVTSTGAFESDLTGRLVLGGEGRARLEAEGTFGDQEQTLLLVSDGERMRITNGEDTVTASTPPHLEEALIVGLTRMGILHNLARLVEAAPPDHADGDVREWVRTRSFRRGERGSVGYDIEVDGRASGSAMLFLSPGTRLPGERRQTVEFPEGEMRVTEIYGAVSVGAGSDPSEFELD